MEPIVRTLIERRIVELQDEIAMLTRQLPTTRRANHKAETTVTASARTRKPMSAAARKAIGQRMRKYWKERRASS